MNTGIQDSLSLAEALTSTLQDGDEARLDVWAAQCHKVASDVVKLTDRMTRYRTFREFRRRNPWGSLASRETLLYAC